MFAQIVQENVALQARHACTRATESRARLRTEKFTAFRKVLKKAFAVPLMPEWRRKTHRDAPEGPYQKALAYRLHKERYDFARSKGNA